MAYLYNDYTDLVSKGEGRGNGARFVEMAEHEFELCNTAVSDRFEPRVTFDDQFDVSLNVRIVCAVKTISLAKIKIKINKY
jgi:hypothetical protein